MSLSDVVLCAMQDSRAVGKVRKRRVNPLNIDPENVEGTEHMHIAMVNRETGKRITGARAPPLRNLTRWLERNPAFDIDPKWMHIVNAWVSVSYFLCFDSAPIFSCSSIMF